MSFERPMTEEEVRRSYRFAKNPESQIQILSQINGETPKKIRRVIEGQTWEEATEPRRYISNYQPKGVYKSWTYSEIENLKQMVHNNIPRKEIAFELKRTLSATARMIYNLKKGGKL